jgi:c-di-GMP phosphodiesterase
VSAPEPALASPVSAESPVLVARQGIYDSLQKVVAYELLYRGSSEATQAGVTDGANATLRVIANAFLEIGLDKLSGDVPAHINYPARLLAEALQLPVPPARVVIEVVPEGRADSEVLNGIAMMKSHGHRIAVSSHSSTPDGIADPALLDLADIVKIDVSSRPAEALECMLQELRQRKVTIVAQRVETAESFRRCVTLGFDLFQGYFLQHPKIFSARPVPAGRLGTLKLVATLQTDDSSVQDVERLISADTSLFYRVLRCINSSYYRFDREIDSMRQAIVILGFERLRQLCAVVALQSLEDRPAAVLVEAIARARLCEQLGRLRGKREAPALFIMGLFSTLDVITGVPMQELLDGLPLSPPIFRALLSQEGPLGKMLIEARTVERGEWNEIRFPGIRAAEVQKAYTEAVVWAESTYKMVSA